MNRRRVLILLFTALASSGGCAVFQLPKPLTRAESARLRDSHIDVTIGVLRKEEMRPQLAAVRGVAAFRKMGLFDRIEFQDAYGDESPDLVAEFEEVLNPAGAYIPVGPLLTLGIIPTVGREEIRIAVTFGPGDSITSAAPDRVRIEFSYESHVIIGWLAVPLPVLPEWAMEGQRQHERLYQRLALEIIEQQNALRRIVADR